VLKILGLGLLILVEFRKASIYLDAFFIW